MNKSIKSVSTVVTFIVFIFGITIATIVAPKKDFSENENRTLATSPEFSVEKLVKGQFATEYEAYLTDQFLLRDTWIAIKSLSEIALNKSDINGVYLAGDNYLIEKHDPDDKADPISMDNAIKNVDRVSQFIDKNKDNIGSEHIKFMLIPTAGVILKDKLPAFATTFDQMAVIDHAKEAAGDNFLDVTDVLKENKENYLYYRTDHHWTMNGTYLAYEAWANSMGIKPYSVEDFNILSTDGFKGTIYSKLNFALKLDTVDTYELKNPLKVSVSYMDTDKTTDSYFEKENLSKKDKYTVYLDGNHSLIKIDTSLKNGRKLLIIKDSYAHSFATLAANHFETTYVVDFRYYRNSIEKLIEENEITDILVLYNVIHFSKDDKTKLFLK